MTQEERKLYDAANEYAWNIESGDLNTNRDSFIAGAQWQKQQMIDRAVEWLKYYIHYDDFGGNMEWLVPFENDECMIQHFKTYMEE